jgi:hypothetical protein
MKVMKDMKKYKIFDGNNFMLFCSSWSIIETGMNGNGDTQSTILTNIAENLSK